MCKVEYVVHVQTSINSSTVMICVYVDVLLIIDSDSSEIENLKSKMKDGFEMTDIGKLSYFLGM